MGFGICVIGCIALVTDIIGGGIVAYPLLAYGMKKASTLNVNFFYAAVAALFCIPHSALVLFSFLGVIDENTVFYQASYCLFYAIYLLFHIFFFLGASQVYRAGKAEKYASRAMSRLYMTAVYVVWAMMLLLFPSISNAAIGGALQIYKYFVLFFNALYFYDCFARITSREQQERDRSAAEKAEEKKRKGANRS